MDLSELSPHEVAALTPPGGKEAAPSGQPWTALVAQVGEEIAGPLTAVLKRVDAFASTGAIDRQGLRRLREEVEQARRVGIACQQIARFACGSVRQAPERLHLTQALQAVLAQRSGDLHAHGIEMRQALQPIEVIVDPTLLSTLLDTLVDWMLAHAKSAAELRLDMKPWPAQARFVCRFHHMPPDLHADLAALAGPGREVLDDMHWQLLRHAAAAMGLVVRRSVREARVELTLEFPRTVADQLPGLTVLEDDEKAFPSTMNSQPLAGSHVLVVASRREVRVQVREALRHMGLLLDFVNSVEEAAAFCSEAVPHAVIFEALLRGERFNRLRADLLRQAPDLVFIEIIEEGAIFEVSGVGNSSVARIGRDAVPTSLASAVEFELLKAQQ
ncbi:hypothetical protein [Caldimonas thermodepolymerans]|uniref:Response regulatory domain-containing protein n=1 Tax=Caldimonas thermodepolymerans TaxID=215580 RepID=A0AA46HWG4_9BURK|nr:hypothetical protein [Caldimonas thermodepolymerans]TCP08130.1 hypothetical protein EV676_103163 [Caldimonas thermodepolymerans]UZG48752.1 hypothetical protein ONS87_03770 [Caldimonas thermodepolymerans]